MATDTAKKRAIVYVDGFNLYHGSLKGTPHKWLDLQACFEMLRNNDNVFAIKYFTAPMHGDPSSWQTTYLKAIETLAKVTVFLGRYKTKRVDCRVPNCKYDGDRRFTTWEEKRTDVNIAVEMMDDAYQNTCDLFVVVSGDSDLVPPINAIKSRFPEKTIAVYVPARNKTRGAATEIRLAADKNATLPQQILRRAQLPPKVSDGAGGFIDKPDSW